jgi:hypothetical protein
MTQPRALTGSAPMRPTRDRASSCQARPADGSGIRAARRVDDKRPLP